MNIYALLSLCASAISISLGVSVYYINTKSVVNRLFTLTMSANAYWAFCELMLTNSNSVETATLWSKALFLWPFLLAFMLHFALAFTENELLKNKLIYVVLYFPALLFSLIDLTTNWISATPTLKFWGYATSIPSDSVVTRLDGIWAAVLALLVLFLFFGYYNRVFDKTRKLQTKFVAVAFAVPIVLSLLTDSLFVASGVNFPGLGAISGSLFSFFVVYAMWRYELFGFRPEIAAENVFSTMVDSVILVNLQEVIVKVNRSLVETLGYSEDELLGKPLSKVLQEAGAVGKAKTIEQIIVDLREQRELRNQEITFQSKSCQIKCGILSCSMVTNSNGKDIGMAFLVHDITEEKEMEQKLIKAERLVSIGELAGILGHDLRNPLNAIRVAAYYLKTKYANMIDSKDESMFESIDKSINYSDKIVNDLIDYSSEINLDLKTATPKSLVKSTLALISPPQNVQVIDKTKEAPEFQVDAGKMSRGFVNIIKNAFDAMPNGGKLIIKSEKIDDDIVFSFKDTGDGMTQKTLGKLWTPLFTTKAKGMGFGLAICKRTVEAHDGKITAESALKKGTTIKVELPLNLKSKDSQESLFL
jgi:PAS domain S-box-containing protein